jgi:deoxycytidine triphosphate deaminase
MPFMLNRDEIKSLGIIADGTVQNFRAASYDVRVGTITAVESQSPVRLIEGEFYSIPPQGMVEVTSFETVKMPKEIAGYASVKTGLSRRELLALNTGIIDPSYEGPVSAVMVNFGRTPFSLHRHDVFLRLTFHRYDPPADFEALQPVDRQDFVRERKKEVAERFSSSFLDITGHIAEAARGAFWRYLPAIAIIVGFVALLVTSVTFGVTLGVTYWHTEAMSKDQLKAELGSYFRNRELDSYKRRLADLEKRERDLEAKSAAVSHGELRPAAPNQPPKEGEHK